jgi:hypothetical protein
VVSTVKVTIAALPLPDSTTLLTHGSGVAEPSAPVHGSIATPFRAIVTSWYATPVGIAAASSWKLSMIGVAAGAVTSVLPPTAVTEICNWLPKIWYPFGLAVVAV